MAVITTFSVLTRSLGFLYKIFLSRTLSTELLGVYSIVISVYMVFATLLNSGLPLAVSKSTIINYDKDNKKSNGSVTSALIISLLFCLIIFIFILLGQPFFTNYFNTDNAYYLLLLLIPAIIFTAIYAPFKGYLWGREKFLEVSVVEFIEQIIKICVYFMCFYLFIFSSNLFSAGIAISVGCILSTLIGIAFFRKSNGRLSAPKQFYKPIFKSAAPITLIRLASTLTQPFMAFILPIMLVSVGFTHEQALSQLGIAMAMTLPLLSIPSTLIGSFAMANFPNLTSLNHDHNNSQLKRHISLSINFTLCCSFWVIPFFLALSEPLCIFLYDNQTAGIYLKYACWLIIPMGLSQITTSILNSLNLEMQTFKYYLCSCVLLVILIIVLPQFVGIYALMYAMGLSFLLVSILNIIKINKTVKSNKTFLGILIKLLIITLPVFLATQWLYNLIIYIFPKFVSVILCGGFSMVAFTILIAVFNVIDITYFKNAYMHKRKNKKLNKAFK